MSRLHRSFVGFLLLAIVACDRGPEGPASVPDPDLNGMEPQVIELLERTRRALVADTGSATAWGEMGTAFDAHGLKTAAESCYREALSIAPEAFVWSYLLAIVREIQGAEAAEVVERFEQAQALRPDYAPIHVRLGDALSLRGEHEAAEARFRRAIELQPQSAVAHRGLGQILLALGRPQEATEPLARAGELEPRDLAAYTGLAQAWMRLGQPDRAAQVIERSRGLEPVSVFDDPVYARQVFSRGISSSRLFNRALAHIRDGRYAEAIEGLERVLAARPDDASAHYWIGTAHQRLGQDEPAIEYLERAVEIERTLALAWFQLAEIFAGQGRIEEAEYCLERAESLRPLDAGQQRAIAEALVRGRAAAQPP